MKPLKPSLTTFMKIASSTDQGKYSQIKKFMSPGGMDFYKEAKAIIIRIARGELTLTQAEKEIAKIKSDSRRKHSLDLVSHFFAWFAGSGLKWAAPPKAEYVSPSELLKVRLNPELSFLNASGGRTYLSLWCMTRPKLTDGLAAEGMQCLVNEVKPGTNDEVGILHVRKNLVYEQGLITPGSQARLMFDLNIVEEIWKDLHNPKMSRDDVISHIASFGAVPPAI